MRRQGLPGDEPTWSARRCMHRVPGAAALDRRSGAPGSPRLRVVSVRSLHDDPALPAPALVAAVTHDLSSRRPAKLPFSATHVIKASHTLTDAEKLSWLEHYALDNGPEGAFCGAGVM